MRPWAVFTDDGKRMGITGFNADGSPDDPAGEEMWGIMGKKGELIDTKADAVFTKL